MKVSIIVLNWNTLPYLKECVSAVRTLTEEDYELIIVENGSTEDSIETFDYIKIHSDKDIFNKKNNGFAGGCNQGAKIASGDILVFLSNDTEPTENWLTELLKTMEKTGAGMVGPLGNPKEKNGKRYWQYEGQFLGDIEVVYLSGFCMAIKRDIFKEVGGFDEDFGIGLYEDTNLCDKVRHTGHKLFVSANSLVHHKNPSRSLEKNKIDYDKLDRSNKKLYLKKKEELWKKKLKTLKE